MSDHNQQKILMLGWEFPPHNTGGLGVACLGLAQALVERDVAINFVLPKKIPISHDRINLLFANVPNISIEQVDTALVPYTTVDEYGVRVKRDEHDTYGGTLLEEVRRYAQLIRPIALRENFDVIHAHDWLSFLAGVEAKRVTGKPLIVHVHATSFDQSGGNSVHPDVYYIEKLGMDEADIVIAVSQFTKDMIIEKYGISGDKIRVVHNGVLQMKAPVKSNEQFVGLKNAGYKIVLYLGRITIQKGVDHFLNAAKRTLEYEPDTIFIVAGSGDMEGQLLQQAAHLGISQNVLFHMGKYVGGEERSALLEAADLFVMPSVSEPFGLIPLEALLESNTPVLISKQSGVAEVLQNSLKVDFWDVDEMANKMIAVLRHQPLRNQLAHFGRSEAEGITWHKAAGKCIDVYHELISIFKTKVS